jgi:hypothetical protein
LPIVDQPAGAVIASLLRIVTCATIRSPVATALGRTGRLVVMFARFEMTCTEQPAKSPVPGPQAPTRATGSITYGSGSCASFRRSSSVRPRSDQRAARGVMSLPSRSKMATGWMLSGEVPNFTEPSSATCPRRLLASCQRQTLLP